MKGPLGLIATGGAVLALLAWVTGGWALLGLGLSNAWSTTWQALPLVVGAFLVVGQLQVLVTKERISRLLKRYTGFRGILLTVLAGGAFPGPPYVYYPFLSSFRDRPIPFYLFFSFLAGKHVYDFARLPMEFSLIPPHIAFLRNLITLPVPVLMGFTTWWIFGDQPMNVYFQLDESGGDLR